MAASLQAHLDTDGDDDDDDDDDTDDVDGGEFASSHQNKMVNMVASLKGHFKQHRRR